MWSQFKPVDWSRAVVKGPTNVGGCGCGCGTAGAPCEGGLASSPRGTGGGGLTQHTIVPRDMVIPVVPVACDTITVYPSETIDPVDYFGRYTLAEVPANSPDLRRGDWVGYDLSFGAWSGGSGVLTPDTSIGSGWRTDALHAHLTDAYTVAPSGLRADWPTMPFDLRVNEGFCHTQISWLYMRPYVSSESACNPVLNPAATDELHPPYLVSGVVPYAVCKTSSRMYVASGDYTIVRARVYLGMLNHCSYFVQSSGAPWNASDLDQVGEWDNNVGEAAKGALARVWLSFFNKVEYKITVVTADQVGPGEVAWQGVKTYTCSAADMPNAASYDDSYEDLVNHPNQHNPTPLAFSHPTADDDEMSAYLSFVTYVEGCVCLPGDVQSGSFDTDEAYEEIWRGLIRAARVEQTLTWVGPSGTNTVTRNFRLTAKNMTSFGNLRVAHERIRPGAPSRWLLRNVDYERLGVACVHFEDGGASCWELL